MPDRRCLCFDHCGRTFPAAKIGAHEKVYCGDACKALLAKGLRNWALYALANGIVTTEVALSFAGVPSPATTTGEEGPEQAQDSPIAATGAARLRKGMDMPKWTWTWEA